MCVQVERGRSHALLQEAGIDLVDIVKEQVQMSSTSISTCLA